MDPIEEEFYQKYKGDLQDAENDAMWSTQLYDRTDEEAFAMGARMSLLRLAGFPSGQLDKKKTAFNKRATIQAPDSETHYRIFFNSNFPAGPLNFGMHEVRFEHDQTVTTRRKFALSAFSGSAFRYIKRVRTNRLNGQDPHSAESIRTAGIPVNSEPWALEYFPDIDMDTLVSARLRPQSSRVKLLHTATKDLLPVLASLSPDSFKDAAGPQAENRP